MKDEVLSDPCDSDARAPYASYSGAQLSPRCPDSFITCQVIIREREREPNQKLLFSSPGVRPLCAWMPFLCAEGAASRLFFNGRQLRLSEFWGFSIIHSLFSLWADFNQTETGLALRNLAPAVCSSIHCKLCKSDPSGAFNSRKSPIFALFKNVFHVIL